MVRGGFIKIKNKIKKILEANFLADSLLMVNISNDELTYYDGEMHTEFNIKFSELEFYEELKNIDLNQNMDKFNKNILESLFNNFKSLNLSKIVNFFYDFGFFYDDYAEFLYFEDGEITDIVKNFKFDEYEVKIGHPSDIFKLIFSDMGNDKYFDDWGFWNTIKVKNINKDNFQEVIQIALYLINKKSIGINGRVAGYLSPYNYEEIKNKGPEETIAKILYKEPLIFYNKGLELGINEFSYIYFYKVLEYFFLINRKNEFIDLINEYNSSNDKYKINNFIQKVSKLPSSNERENLKKLILNLDKKIDPIIEKAYKKQLITKKDKTILIDELYKKRNSIVHGKDDSKLKITLPSIIHNKENNDWIEIIREIANIIIESFCYE